MGLEKVCTNRRGNEKKWDVIIIGTGPNGLVAGSYLAKAGLKVLLLEKSYEAGGGLATEPVTLSNRRILHNTHAIYMMMTDYAPPYKDLDAISKIIFSLLIFASYFIQHLAERLRIKANYPGVDLIYFPDIVVCVTMLGNPKEIAGLVSDNSSISAGIGQLDRKHGGRSFAFEMRFCKYFYAIRAYQRHIAWQNQDGAFEIIELVPGAFHGVAGPTLFRLDSEIYIAGPQVLYHLLIFMAYYQNNPFISCLSGIINYIIDHGPAIESMQDFGKVCIHTLPFPCRKYYRYSIYHRINCPNIINEAFVSITGQDTNMRINDKSARSPSYSRCLPLLLQ